MSKYESTHKVSDSLYSRKDLGQAVKVLQSLANNFEKIEASLADSERARAAEDRYNERILRQQTEIADITSRYQSLEKDRQKEIVSYANTNLKLVQEFDARLKQKDKQYELLLKEIQEREAAQVQKWKLKLDSEKAQAARVRENESSNRHELEATLKNSNDSWQQTEQRLQATLKEMQGRMTELTVKNKALIDDLAEHQVILKGRDTEMQRLGSRLLGLEAFSRDSPDETRKIIQSLQLKIRQFCVLCVESADFLPGWHPLPTELRHDGLPRVFSAQSTAGRFVLVGAIQHSLYGAMMKNIFEPCGVPGCQEIGYITNALHQNNRPHEAIWRLMTVNTICGRQQVMQIFKDKLDRSAGPLLNAWHLFSEDVQRLEFQSKLSKLFHDTFEAWLSVLKGRTRVSVIHEWDRRFFETDTDEEPLKIPGDFVPSVETHPILCLSPAFVVDASAEDSTQPIVIHRGTSMSRRSPALLTALEEEKEVSSPRLSHKKPNLR